MNRWRAWRMRLPALLLFACLWVLCRQGQASAMASDAAAAPPRPASCSTVGRSAPSEDAPSDDVASANALQKNIRTNPLYQMLAATSHVTACRVAFHEPGKFDIDYRFGPGNWLRLKRDANIEYTQWTVRFTGALKEPAQAMLARAARASFGPDGCRIDWSESETQTAADDASATETIYRGAVCNCQARIRRNAHGRVDGFTLSSAC
jgi:hypothetical protein